MISERTVRDMNPWWKSAAGISSDEQIRQWEASNVKYDPRLRLPIRYDYEPSNTVIYTLHGAWQTGKTTLVKLQIREFLDGGVDPFDVFYYSMDASNNPQDVVDAVTEYLKIRGRRGSGRARLFLDGAAAVRDWQFGIKWLVDADLLFNCTVLVTGSHAFNVKNARERMPGRRGVAEGGHDKILRPLGFREYASLMDSDVANLASKTGAAQLSVRQGVLESMAAGEIDERVESMRGYEHELDLLLERYMLTGGTPRAVGEYAKTRRISRSLYGSYLDGASGQCAELNRNEAVLKRVGAAVAKSQGGRVSWSVLSKMSSVGSPNTTQEYAHILGYLSILEMICLYDLANARPKIAGGRKMHFCDPIFLHMFNGWTGGGDAFDASLEYLESDVNRGNMLGGIVADHLVRRAFETGGHRRTFDHLDHVLYWKDQKGREVDFVFRYGGLEIPIVVRCADRVNRRDLAPVASFLDASGASKGVVVSKSELDARSDYVTVPASIFLMML